MSGSFVPLPTLDLVAAAGGALAVVGFALRLALPGASPGAGAGDRAAWRTVSGGAALGGAIGAFWLGGNALVLLFAVVSAIALADFLAHCVAAEWRAHAACCYLFVPLQYGIIATGRADLAIVVVPLAATLALPLLALAAGGARHLVERIAVQCWGVMAWVYLLSHLPALLLLGGPAFEERNAGLVAFVVAVALATQALQHRSDASRRARIASVVAPVVLGAALAWMTPFPVHWAAALALAVTLAGSAGCRVLGAMRREYAHGSAIHALDRVALRLDALVFAAPVAFHACRAGLAG